MKTLLRTVKPAPKSGKIKLSAIKKAVASVQTKRDDNFEAEMRQKRAYWKAKEDIFHFFYHD